MFLNKLGHLVLPSINPTNYKIPKQPNMNHNSASANIPIPAEGGNSKATAERQRFTQNDRDTGHCESHIT